MITVLWIIFGVCVMLALLCVLGAQAGDNVDARATAGLFYLPAMFFGAVALIVLIIALLCGA